MTTRNPTNISLPLSGSGRKQTGGSAADARVNCPKCEHYYVTWDTAFPRGCKLYGFKTATLPSYTVHEVTGGRCEHYKSKA